VETEKPMGVIVQFGGQTPLNLSAGLHQAGVPILGTQPESIDRAEDRKHFQALLNKLGLVQPANDTALTIDEAVRWQRLLVIRLLSVLLTFSAEEPCELFMIVPAWRILRAWPLWRLRAIRC
jgi:hypothetical protein